MSPVGWRRHGLTAGLCGVLVLATTELVGSAPEGPAWLDRCIGQGEATLAYRRDMEASMHAMMMGMQASEHVGDPDADFLAMMVPHHQGAIEMAKAVLQHGRDPSTRQLAEDIIATQRVEIDSMRKRLALLRGEVRDQGASFPALSGTRGR